MCWLELNHPEAIPNDRYTLAGAQTSTPTSAHENQLSLADEFSYVSPPTPVGVLDGQTPGTSTPTPCGHAKEPHSPSSAEVPGASVSRESEQSILTQLMQVPATFTPKPASSKSRAVTGAQVLTSTECLTLIKEKELKKKKEAEEKEKRKKEREGKKQIRQEQLKKKADERAKKAAERAKKTEEKARKANERVKAKKGDEGTERAESGKPDANSESRLGEKNDGDSDSSCMPRPKRRRIEEEINCDECSICFGTFQEDVKLETGREWVECACGRWVHEVCVVECIVDVAGKERFCPICLV